MKINIIGLPASGKTTLASWLSREYSIPCLNLDTLVFQTKRRHQRVRVPSEVYLTKVNKFIEKKHWIVEGIYPIDEVMQSANSVIFLQRPLYNLLYFQWLRYVTDSQQRNEYGIISNLKLSKFIIQLYFNLNGITVYDGQDPMTLDEIKQKLNIYRKKLVNLHAQNEIEDFLRKFKRRSVPKGRDFSRNARMQQ